MEISNKLIIECAKVYGFEIPNHLTDEDILITRARTTAFVGNKDLGEWWLSYSGCFTVFRVTDDNIKVYLRDIKIKDILDV